MKIIEDKENFLMNRKEIKMIVEAEKNPSYEDALKMISEHFKSAPEHVVVKNVKGKFGRDTFLVQGFVYKTAADKDKFEPKVKVKKTPGQPA